MASVPYIQESEFQTTISNPNRPVLVDFTASWCGPCKSIAPLLDAALDEYAGRADIVKVDIDKARGLAAKLGIRGVPTLMVYKNGAMLDKHVGALNKAQLDKLLSSGL